MHRAEDANLRAGETASCSVFRAPREYNGEEDSEYSGIRASTADDVSPRALLGRQECVFCF